MKFHFNYKKFVNVLNLFIFFSLSVVQLCIIYKSKQKTNPKTYFFLI